MDYVIWEKVIDSKTVNATASVVSAPINVGGCKSFGFEIVVKSGSAPNVKLEYQIIASNQGDAALVGSYSAVPGVDEGGLSWTIPTTGGTLVASITSSNKVDGFSPMVTKWMRLKVTGIAANGADTIVTVRLGMFGGTH